MTTTSYGSGYGTGGFGAAQRNQYLEDSVLSAPPARLLTMLYDRLLLDLGRAETAQQAAQLAGRLGEPPARARPSSPSSSPR